MKTAIIVIISLVAGGLIGGFLAFGTGAGVGAAGGLIVGSQAGACLALEAAKEQGMLSSEQANQLVAATVAKLQGKAKGVDTEIDWIASEGDCAKMVAEMEKATE